MRNIMASSYVCSAMSHPARMFALLVLTTHGKLTSCQVFDLASLKLIEDVAISKSSMTRHLDALVESGLVKYMSYGDSLYYSISEKLKPMILALIGQITSIAQFIDGHEEENIND